MDTVSVDKSLVVLSRDGFTEVLAKDSSGKGSSGKGSSGKRRLSIVAHAADPLKNRAVFLAREMISSRDLLVRSPDAYLRLEVLDREFLKLTLSNSLSHASVVLSHSATTEALALSCRQVLLTDYGALEEALKVATERLTVK